MVGVGVVSTGVGLQTDGSIGFTGQTATSVLHHAGIVGVRVGSGLGVVGAGVDGSTGVGLQADVSKYKASITGYGSLHQSGTDGVEVGSAVGVGVGSGIGSGETTGSGVVGSGFWPAIAFTS